VLGPAVETGPTLFIRTTMFCIKLPPGEQCCLRLGRRINTLCQSLDVRRIGRWHRWIGEYYFGRFDNFIGDAEKLKPHFMPVPNGDCGYKSNLDQFIKLDNRYKEIARKETRVEEYLVKDADLVIVAYGTTSRIAKASAEALRKNNKKAGIGSGVCRLRQRTPSAIRAR